MTTPTPKAPPAPLPGLAALLDPLPPPTGRFTEGPSIDGKGEFSLLEGMAPLGEEPQLPPKPPYTFNPPTKDGTMGMMAKAKEKVKDALDCAVPEARLQPRPL